MTGSIVPFRPKRRVADSSSLDDRLEELEELETLLEMLHEHRVESRAELEQRIEILEAALEAEIMGPERS